MATPIGHSLAGYAVYVFAKGAKSRGDRELMLLCIFAAMAPDLDFLPGLLVGTPALYHQGISHSLGFTLPLSLGLAGIGHLRGRSFSVVFGSCFIASLSHLVLDFLGPDTRPPYGIPLLWPISGEYFISPVPVLLGVRHATTAGTTTQDWMLRLLHWHNLAAITWEVVLMVPFIFLGHWYRGISMGRQRAG